MTFQLELAQPDDATRIAEIHVNAFGSNALIRAIHAADEDLRGLFKAVENKALADMRDMKTTVLVVRHVNGNIVNSETDMSGAGPGNEADNTVTRDARGDVVGFAKWTHPIYPSDDYSPPLWNLPESTDLEILRPWRIQVEKVEEEVIGQTPRYELTYLAVDARFARQGVGTMMVKWALDLCETQQCPAYVESTVEAVPFYEKMGFRAVGTISLDISGKIEGEDVGVYEEVGCIYKPLFRSQR